MATLATSSHKPGSARRRLPALIATFSLLSVARLSAFEDPPGCSGAHGGLGTAHRAGLNFNLLQAHVGDAVPVFPSLGMEGISRFFQACRAINVTGTVYIATGPLTNFLLNVTLDPGTLVSCPVNALCQPGPYNITITPKLVGAGVSTQLGFVPGFTKTVRAAAVNFNNIQSEPISEEFSDLVSASIQIVSPNLQVVNLSAYPPGQNCFQAGQNIGFTGYVTNSGDIELTNVTVRSGRSSLLLLRGADTFLPLPTNSSGGVALDVGAIARFTNSFVPLPQELYGPITDVVVARGTDTTVIGGPRASVTNTASITNFVCLPATSIFGSRLDGTSFGFSFPSVSGFRYVVQSSLSLGPPDWHDLTNFLGNGGSVDFFHSVRETQRFYRVEVQRP